MSVCGHCIHIKSETDETNWTQYFCEILQERGEQSLLSHSQTAQPPEDYSDRCRSFEWDGDTARILRELDHLHWWVYDLDKAEYKLVVQRSDRIL